MKTKRKRLTKNQKILRDFMDGVSITALTGIYWERDVVIQSILRKAFQKARRK